MRASGWRGGHPPIRHRHLRDVRAGYLEDQADIHADARPALLAVLAALGDKRSASYTHQELERLFQRSRGREVTRRSVISSGLPHVQPRRPREYTTWIR